MVKCKSTLLSMCVKVTSIGDADMNIRRFKRADAEFCFKVRANAFIRKFYDEIGPEAVAAGVNAYMPEDYIRMAEEAPLFIIEEKRHRIGFFMIKQIDRTTAELHLIYLDLNYLGKGIGAQCVRFMEDWILSEWKGVNTFIVDTIIPEYNRKFYEKMGFTPVEEVVCTFPDLALKSLRLKKQLLDKG